MTPMSIPAGSHFDIVFAFDNAPVALEKLTVVLPPEMKGKPSAPRIEILASTLSPHAGFQSIRTCMLKPKAGKQEFPFLAIGARWILLRISPAHGEKQVTFAEIGVWGGKGQPVTHYAFAEAPAKAFSVLSQLKQLVKVRISRDEASLFADAEDGKLDQWTFAEAALLASGVSDAKKRSVYLTRLDELEVGARKAVAAAKTDSEKGEKLLRYLHAESLAKGYKAKQTDLSVLLDTQTYNCVSSAVLYNVIGRRLGLDLRAIEVPDHAFSILYIDTKHADVETTNKLGFNPSRDPAIQKELLKQTGFRYIADRHPEQRREVREAGLAAIIYYNHGVQASKEKRYGEALFLYFRALNLDPEFTSAVKNVLSALANWGVELSNANKFEQALAVVNVGLDLAPKDATLLRNRKAIWSERVTEAMEAGENERALALLQEAHQQLPDGNFRAMQSWVFLRPAEKLVKQSRWENALALVESGLPQVDPDAGKELLDWRRGLFLRWSNAQLKQKEFAQSIKILERGRTIDSNDPRMTKNLGYVAQEWVADTLQQQGPEQAEAVLNALLEKHGDVESIKRTAHSYVIRLVNRLRKEKKYTAALKTITRCKPFLDSEESAVRLTQGLYDFWAKGHIKEQQWEQALSVYENALKQYPGDSHLTNNSQATWDRWARGHMKTRQWSKAADVYAKAMAQLPESGFGDRLGYLTQEWLRDASANQGAEAAEKVLTDLLARFPKLDKVRDAALNHCQRTVSKFVSQKKFPEALDAVDRSRRFLQDEQKSLDLTHYVYDKWSANFASGGKWKEAVAIYSQALKEHQKDSHLTKNAIAAWNRWAGKHINKKDWPAAIEVYETALKEFPDSSLLKNNLRYCRQKQEKKEK